MSLVLRSGPNTTTSYDFLIDEKIDGLPYVDTDLLEDTDRKAELELLIEQERLADRGAGSNPGRAESVLHPSLAPEYSIKHQPLLDELKRVSENKALNAIDVQKYRPQKASGDLHEIKKSLDGFRAATVYQQDRSQNLHLLQTYGGNVWKVHLYQLNHLIKRRERELEKVQLEIEQINTERKERQTKLHPLLLEKQARWVKSVQTRIKLQVECLRIRDEIKRLEASS